MFLETSLTELREAPLTVKQFIEFCLYHPQHGYYMTKSVFGTDGDYVTSPEITQVFGELLAIWCLNFLKNMPTAPASIALIELGPGRGTMMTDILRVFEHFPEIYDLLTVYLLEISPTLKEQQRQKLSNYRVEWIHNMQDIPMSDATFILANEFFDALPIEQYVYIDNKWLLRKIGWVDNKIDFLGPKNVPVRQICPDYEIYMRAINQRLKSSKGAAIIIDYGDDTTCDHIHGDTLQAVHKHKRASTFDYIGHQDLSHAVDFGALKRLADSAFSICLTTQREFLLEAGLDARVKSLLQKASPTDACLLNAAAARLIAPSAMGQLFKVLTIRAAA